MDGEMVERRVQLTLSGGRVREGVRRFWGGLVCLHVCQDEEAELTGDSLRSG